MSKNNISSSSYKQAYKHDDEDRINDDNDDDTDDDDDGWEKVTYSNNNKKSKTKNRSMDGHNNDITEELFVMIQQHMHTQKQSPNTNTNTNTNKKPDPSSLFMILLIGLPGSGKSTFSQLLVKGNPSKYVRICQDVLGDRQSCEMNTRQVLSNGKIPIIDRINLNKAQRGYFTNIASEFKVPVDCILFDHGREECIDRCESRMFHETLQPSIARKVFIHMQLFPPKDEEIKKLYRLLRKTVNFDQTFLIALGYLKN